MGNRDALKDGWLVRTTVRDSAREARLRASIASRVGCSDGLSFAVADLLRDDGWESAAEGCHVVLHIASPLGRDSPRDRDALVEPARGGALRVLRAAVSAGAERVVMTSAAATARQPPNNWLLSPNKSYRLLYQPDGNLVLYRVADNSVVWQSNTPGQTPSRLVMQGDGNLVMYGIDNNAQWHAATFGNENSSALLLDEGKLVIVNSIGQTIWSNGVVPPLPAALPVRSKLIPGAALLPGQSLNSVNGVYSLTYQTDGNLVVYKDGATAQWQSGTVGLEPGRVCMQSDGNLVIYGKDGAAQWATSTNSAANANSELIMQTDGNLVIYNRNGAAIWSIR